MARAYAALVVAVFLICSVIFPVSLSVAQNQGTIVGGVLTADTTWTLANSPYSLKAPVVISAKETLTINPGVTVNLGPYYIQVDGTLNARGTDSYNIVFGSSFAAYGNIAFTDSSTNWDEQRQTGCIIQNSVLTSTSISISKASPKINNNSIRAGINIDENTFPFQNGTINWLSSAIILNNTLEGDIGIHASSPVVSGNSILGGIDVGAGSPIIKNNIIYGGGAGNGVGINVSRYETNVTIGKNIIYGCPIGIETSGPTNIIENLIVDNQQGVIVSDPTIEIQYNSIENNGIGIRILNYAPELLSYNNLQNNTEFSLYLEASIQYPSINAANNWWGSSDMLLIKATVRDYNNDHDVPSVNFSPILTSPNPQASPTEFVPIQTAAPTTIEPATTTKPTLTPSRPPNSVSPSPNPTSLVMTQTSFNIVEVAILVVLIVIAALLATLIVVIAKKKG